jgi:hypothetical protein
LVDFQVFAPGPGGRETRPYDTLLSLLGKGWIYPGGFILARTELLYFLDKIFSFWDLLDRQ